MLGVKKLKDVWNDLPELEYTRKYVDKKSGLRIYEVVGKKFQETASVDYVLKCLKKAEDGYGERVKEAEENKVDFKSVSHALRAAYQTKQILLDNTIIFPLKEAPYLLEVKQGKRDYLTDVAPTLEALMDEVEELSKKSTLPEKVDREYWNNWLVNIIEEYICNGNNKLKDN